MNMASTSMFLHLAIIMWAVCAYCFGASPVVHIAPNAASCEEVENCVFLTETLGDNPFVGSNLVFLPGNHVLYTTLLFSEVSEVTLLGDCSRNNTCPLITCSSDNNLILNAFNVDRTVITNLRFANCHVIINTPNTASLDAMPGNSVSSSQITNSSFSHDSTLTIFGGDVRIEDCSFANITSHTTVLVKTGSNVSIEDCSFTNITSHNSQTNAVILSGTNVNIEDCSFTHIISYENTVVILDSVAHFNGNNRFANNVALSTPLVLSETNATFSDNTLFFNNTGGQVGSLSIINSYVSFKGNTIFHLCNSGIVGALVASNSSISFYDETLFEQNNAEQSGAMFGEMNSSFYVFGNLTFYNNTATALGGGLNLVFASKIYLAQGSSVVFQLNHAGFGGAIYVEDTSSCVFTSEPCFFQVMDLADPCTSLTFINNFATFAGDDIYGGSIDRCTTNNVLFLSTRIFDSIATFHHDNPTISSIASDATQVCECINNAPVCQPMSQCTVNAPENCTINRTIYPGEDVQVTVAAVGQRGGVAPGGIRTLNNTLNFNFVHQIPFSDLETVRGINANCTTLSYAVTSTSRVQTLSLYPRPSICLNTDTPLSIALFFLQPCPYGFQTDPSTGACVCEERLMSIGDISCNITHRSFQHRGEHWIGFDNSSKGLIIHDGSCPFDYCITNQMVNFTLEDTNEQCSFNRSGLLCGECQDGLSIVLGGTSRCEPCSNDYLALLIPSALAGVALVVLLFVCELSVVAGTLSGVIFYANVVQINRDLFFKSNNVLTTFIAWLNLDLGIETCFYDGMDSYGKTWFQFLFPFYIWAIVGLIILLSRCSKRVTKVLGSHPIAVLATLFFLSYVKIMKVFLSVVSYTILDYPNEVAIMWKLDANVGYLQGKHIPLFVFAVLVFLLLFVPYTVLLLFGQWFQTKAHWKCMAWAKSQRLKAFLDVYHAPYKDQHRYWPGLLLLLRSALAMTTATAAESLLSVTYVVIVTVLFVQLWGWIARGVYKKWPLDALEAVFFVNLGLLMFATYRIECSRGNQMEATNTSVSITLLVSIGILLYHILVLRLKLGRDSAKYWMMKTFEKVSNWKKAQHEGPVEANLVPLDAMTNTNPNTVTFVSLREALLEDAI